MVFDERAATLGELVAAIAEDHAAATAAVAAGEDPSVQAALWGVLAGRCAAAARRAAEHRSATRHQVGASIAPATTRG